MAERVIVAGSNDAGISRLIAERLDAPIVNIYKKRFPDGETYVRILEPETIKDSDAIVVNTLYPLQNEMWIETLYLVNAAKNSGAHRVVAVIPYMAYSRQDKIFLAGEPVSISVMLKALRAAGADYLITVDMHNPESLKEFDAKRAYNVMVSDILASKAREYIENPIVIAPDKGALERAKYAAEALGCEYDYLIKFRDRYTGEVRLQPKSLDISGKDVIIVDDIISTGGTIALASRECLRQGAKRVVVAATHLLLVGGALDKIKNANVYRIVGANTIKPAAYDPIIEYVDITGKIVDCIERIGD